uniref:Uncharacterized protein n=1 Tax=Leersia perrieri TaxID=77586 RepID=A0A0D9UYM1_9ORYZ
MGTCSTRRVVIEVGETQRPGLLLETGAGEIEADIVVAKDGTGTHRKIHDAIKAAPEHSHRRRVAW